MKFSLGRFAVREADPISVEQLSKMAAKKGLSNYDRIVVLGGKAYIDVLGQVFPQKELYTPLSGTPGMGYMLSKLSSALKSEAPL